MSFILIDSIFKFFKNINASESSDSQYADHFLCFCKQRIPLHENEIRRHIAVCRLYQKESPFYRDFLQLPLDTFKAVHLLALKCEFNNFIDLINDHLGKRDSSSSRPSSELTQQQSQFRGKQWTHQARQAPTVSKIERLLSPPILQSGSATKEYCQGCGVRSDSFLRTTKMIVLGSCSHTYCSICMNKQVRRDYFKNDGKIKCQKCQAQINDEDIKEAMGKEKFEDLLSQLVEEKFHVVKCSFCSSMVKLQGSKPVSDITIIPVSNTKVLERQNRLVCPQCNKDQCRLCKAVPYHFGVECSQTEDVDESKQIFHPYARKCGYCSKVYEGSSCNAKECEAKRKIACLKKLKCGHSCHGFKNETQCPPCLKCSSKLNDYCSICFVETLGQAPCITSKCGHIFHYECIMKTLKLQYPGPDISFGFCHCSLCKRWMEFDPSAEPQFILEQQWKLREKINEMALKHLSLDRKHLQSQQQSQQTDQSQYALSIYCYYMCCRCKQPYFGGTKECQQLADDGQIKPEDLICYECAQSETCVKHGREFIIHKCRFCCNKALYFCWGTTHFCNDCHLKQTNGDYLNRKTRDKLPKCLGPPKCPSGGKHRANGEEQALGCCIKCHHYLQYCVRTFEDDNFLFVQFVICC